MNAPRFPKPRFVDPYWSSYDLSRRNSDQLFGGSFRVQLFQPLQPRNQFGESPRRPSRRPLNLEYCGFSDLTERGLRNLLDLRRSQPRQRVMSPHPAAQKQVFGGRSTSRSRRNRVSMLRRAIREGFLGTLGAACRRGESPWSERTSKSAGPAQDRHKVGRRESYPEPTPSRPGLRAIPQPDFASSYCPFLTWVRYFSWLSDC